MKMLSLPLVAATGLLAAPLPCCAVSTTVDAPEKNAQKGESAAPTTLTPPGQENKSKADLDEDEDDFDDEESDDEEDLDEEQMNAPYPFGELKLEPPVQATPAAGSVTSTTSQTATLGGQANAQETPSAPISSAPKSSGQWKAQLPAKNFVIESLWAERPEFQNAAKPDGKPQGAATLALNVVSDTETQPFSLYVLMYIYDPESMGIAMSSPEKVIEQLVTMPAEEVKQYGFTNVITDLPVAKPLDSRAMEERGILKDVSKKVEISQHGKTLYTQYQRVLVGKDFVVLGLVIDGEEAVDKKAQDFFNTITFNPLPAGTSTPVAPAAPASMVQVGGTSAPANTKPTSTSVEVKPAPVVPQPSVK